MRDFPPKSVGQVGSKRGDTISVLTSFIQCVGFWSMKGTLLHAGMPTHILLVSFIAGGSREVASIIVIWAIIHTTLFSLQIGVFGLSGWQIVHKGHDQQAL